MRDAFTSLTVSSWWSAQAAPASFSSLATVLMLTPVTRVIARMDMPSTSMERICARLDLDSLFMVRSVTEH